MTSKAAKRRAKKEQVVTLPKGFGEWDCGATGAANQARLIDEPATEIDPETGKETPNPNGVRRRRREDWVARYAKAGHITQVQAANAAKLRMASEGMRERDPLAALGGVRGGGSDREAIRVDSRRYFRQLWDAIPKASRPVIERIVIDDLPLWRCNQSTRERHFARLSAGLDAISEGARR